MTVQTVVMIVETVLLAVTVVFVIALLRSHAEILRRLAAIDDGTAAAGLPGAARQAGGGAAGGGAAGGGAAGGGAAGGAAADIVGETLAGDAVKFALGAGSPRTLLAFLSSGCAACGPLWKGLHDDRAAPLRARLIVVTKGPERESLSRLRALAPADREVVMSSAAWESFSVPATPHFVLVDGSVGEILGRGSATSWQQIETLLMDSDADTEVHRARGTSQRAARAEQALATAGITDGHPSLYPSRDADPGGQT
jgi:hypothetical protein